MYKGRIMKFTKFLFSVAMIMRCNDVFSEQENAQVQIEKIMVQDYIAFLKSDKPSIDDAVRMTVLMNADIIFDKINTDKNFDKIKDEATKELLKVNELKLPKNKKAFDCHILLNNILLNQIEQDGLNKSIYDISQESQSKNTECMEIIEEFYRVWYNKCFNQ
jgi:hypothetical protein